MMGSTTLALAPMDAPALSLPVPPRYRSLADEMANAIRLGTLRPGDRLPSVRQLAKQYGVSITTALHAYQTLEDEHLIEARPKSGYFVCKTHSPLPANETIVLPAPQASPLDIGAMIHEFAKMAGDPSTVPFSSAVPHPSLLPEKRIAQLVATLNRRTGFSAAYPNYAGDDTLRHEISRRGLTHGLQVAADQMLITNGATEAMLLALRAVTKPGDTVAVESPTFFTLLQTLESLGLRVLEIPTHPQEGISIEALELVTRDRAAVQAIFVMPTFHNPLGCLVSDARKQELVALAAARNIPLIEDDIYGDLHFQGVRPWPLKAWDRTGNVLYCSSFSKTVAPGIRVGWIAPGRFQAEVETLKYITSIATPMLYQQVVARLLSDGGYDRHLRRLRQTLQQQVRDMAEAVARHFPPGCRMNMPAGGYMLWIEMPPQVDSRLVFAEAAARKIGVAPGAVFSKTKRYDHFIRLHCGMPLTAEREASLAALGQIIRDAANAPMPRHVAGSDVRVRD